MARRGGSLSGVPRLLTFPPETSPIAQGDYPFKVVHSSITETESMEKLRPNVFWMGGRKSLHQFQINRKN